MNTPNKLTVTRLCLLPILVLVFFSRLDAAVYCVCLAVLIGAMELTDLLDGIVARRTGQVTDIGKILDPFADAICHLTFFTCFLVKGIMPIWAFLIILWREVAQSFVRMYAMSKGKTIAANIFGKAKTCCYFVTSLVGFAYCCLEKFDIALNWMNPLLFCLFAVSCLASVLSFIIYLTRLGDLKK